MRRTVSLWLKGLAAALISGFAGGVTAGFTAMGIDPEHFNLGGGLRHTLTMAASCGVMNAVIGTMAYLRQSPVPPDDPALAMAAGK